MIGCWLMALTGSNAETSLNASPAAVADGESLILVTVYRLVVDPASRQPVVTLVESDEKRAFPIWIGFAEARAIHSELQGNKHFRPLTHDLLAGVIDKVNGTIYRVIITHTKDNVFYATLLIKIDDTLLEIDARPSDSIVMALKFNAPIYISKSLFEKMSIPLEAPKEIDDEYGLFLQEITAELAAYLSLESSQGLMVSNVHPASQAEKDGIQTGDIFIEIGGQPATNLNSVKDVMEKSKTPLQAKIIRAKQLLTITLHVK